MIELKLKLGDFDGAEATLAQIQDDLNTETLQSIQQDIILRRRIAVRKTDNIQSLAVASDINTAAEPHH